MKLTHTLACLLAVALLGGCGSDGKTGAMGADGVDGTDGTNGTDGVDGVDGVDGADGTNGTDGTDGTDGAPGADGMNAGDSDLMLSGQVTGPAGALADTPLVVVLLDLAGNELAVVAGGQTDAAGNYALRVPNFMAPSSTLLLKAADNASVSALVSAAALDVSVASDGVAGWLRAVAGPEVAITMFSPAEVAALVTDGQAGLVAGSVDLADEDAVRARLAMDLETAVAAAAEASTQVGSPPNPVAVDPPDVVTTINSFAYDLYDVNDETWDLGADGTMDDGTNDSYDTAFTLYVDGNSFSSQTPGTAATTLEDEREAVLGPETDLGGTGLDVTRKIYVPDDMAFARFAEILENPTGSDITVDVDIESNLGSDEGNNTVFASSDGNNTVETGDVWLSNHQDGSDPAVGFLFPGAEPSKSDDNIYYGWPSVTVPAGGQVIMLHWGFQRTGSFPAAVQAITDELMSVGANPPAAYFEGLSVAEAGNTQLAAPRVIGSPGLVAPLAEVTVTVNDDGLGGYDSQTVVTANADGSFSLGLPLVGGDVVDITTDAGTAIQVTVP